MKITFTCKLTMTDEFENSEVEEVYSADVIKEGLTEYIKDGLSEKGNLDFSDCTVTVE